MKHRKLLTALVFTVMLIVLAFLIMSVTSCSPTSTTVQTVSTTLPPDGTLHHPIAVYSSPLGTNNDVWHVATIDGSHETWLLHSLSRVHTGEYILYRESLYRITALNRKALTMTVWGPLDCCAQG